MINVQSAIKAARVGFHELMEEGEPPLENVRLEEVELSEDEKHWMITLGYDVLTDPHRVRNALISNPLVQRNREYKVLQVNAESGDIEAMKIRKV